MHIHVHRRHYGRVVVLAALALGILFLLIWGAISCTVWVSGEVGESLEEGPEPTATLDIPTPGNLVVSVLNPLQTPLPGREVTVDGHGLVRKVVTDGNGDAQFQGLPPDFYRASQVLPPGWYSWYGRSIVIEVTEGQTSYWVFKDEELPTATSTPVPDTPTSVPTATPVPTEPPVEPTPRKCKSCGCYKFVTPTLGTEPCK